MLAHIRTSIFSAIVASSCLLAPSVFAEDSQAILWKVEKADAPASWILATVHSTDAQVAEFSPAANAALSSAKHIGTEYQNDMNSVIEVAQTMLTAKPSLEAIIGKTSFERLVPLIAERGYPVGVTAKLKPWAAVMLLLSPRPSKAIIPMDDLLLKHSMEQQKKYFALESIEQQLAAYQALPTEKQLLLLEALIKNEGKLEQHYKKVISAYLAQDLDLIASLSQTANIILPSKEQAWFNAWQDAAKVERKQIIVERLKFPFEKGDTFVGIGAPLLAGSDGLLAKLRAAGYTLTAVPVQ
mgnify:CR=1 FL=1